MLCLEYVKYKKGIADQEFDKECHQFNFLKKYFEWEGVKKIRMKWKSYVVVPFFEWKYCFDGKKEMLIYLFIYSFDSNEYFWRILKDLQNGSTFCVNEKNT